MCSLESDGLIGWDYAYIGFPLTKNQGGAVEQGILKLRGLAWAGPQYVDVSAAVYKVTLACAGRPYVEPPGSVPRDAGNVCSQNKDIGDADMGIIVSVYICSVILTDIIEIVLIVI